MQTNHVEGQEIFKIKENDLNQLGGSNSSYIEGMKRANIIDPLFFGRFRFKNFLILIYALKHRFAKISIK